MALLSPDDTVKAQLMDAADLDRTLNRLARQIVEHLDDEAEPAERLALVGMQTRGVFLARRLRDKIAEFEGLKLPFGVLDATMYRDDFRQRLRQPVVHPTDIPFDVRRPPPRARRRRALHRPHDARRARRADGPRPPRVASASSPSSTAASASSPSAPTSSAAPSPPRPARRSASASPKIDEADGVWLVERTP